MTVFQTQSARRIREKISDVPGALHPASLQGMNAPVLPGDYWNDA